MKSRTDLNEVANNSQRRIVRSILGSVSISLTLLITIVLPAEYGLDLTGLGHWLGLNEMGRGARTIKVVDVVGGNTNYKMVKIPAHGQPVPLPNPLVHQEEMQSAEKRQMQITIPPEKSTEIKMVLRTGKMVIYSWRVDHGDVYADFHGHNPSVNDKFWVRYKEDQEGSSGSGTLVAPFEGEHGWYFLNYNGFPVTITLDLQGYFDKVVDHRLQSAN